MRNRIGVFLLAAAMFFLPFGTRYIVAPGNLNNGWWEYGTVSLYVSEVLILLAACLSLRGTPKQSEITTPSSRARWLAMTLAGTAFIFLTFRGFNIGWLFHVFSAIIFFLLLSKYREHKTLLLKFFIASAVLQSCIGLLQVVFQKIPASKWLGTSLQLPETLGASVVMHYGERFLRAYGTLPHPNILGAYAVCGLVLALLMLRTDMARKYWYLAAMLICTLGVLFSFSRAAYVSLLLVLILVVLRYGKEKIIKHTAIRVVALSVLFVSFFYSTLFLRVTASGPLEARSINERVTSVSESWQLIKRHPILGVGGGGYTRAVHDEIDAARPSFAYHPVHNVPLLVVTELGLVGIFLILVLMFSHRKNIILSIPFVALIPFLLFDHFLWSLWPGLGLFGFILGSLDS